MKHVKNSNTLTGAVAAKLGTPRKPEPAQKEGGSDGFTQRFGAAGGKGGGK